MNNLTCYNLNINIFFLIYIIKLINKDFGKYSSNKITYTKFICTDNKKKEFKEDNSKKNPIDINNLSYINIYHDSNPNIIITTPIMVCPFGFESNNGVYGIKLQFTNYKSDKHMSSFFNFIRNLEFFNMKYIGITDENIDIYKSQILDSNEKYDPLLNVKIPFLNNRFNINVYNDKYNLNISNIDKFSKVKCDIFIDKIWKYNGKYICKWKLKNIHVY